MTRERALVQRAELGLSWGSQTVDMRKTDYFCPHCGKQDMWQEFGDSGDYYVGVTTHCRSCGMKTLNLDEQWADPPEPKKYWWDQ